MAKRQIIEINQEKCNGCARCIPNCLEGALQIIDGKARLISDLFCDGLGACIGHCPEGAITIEERDAQAYNEKKVMENIVKQGKNVINAHLLHLKEHHQEQYLKQAVEFLKEQEIDVPSIQEETQGARQHAHQHAEQSAACPGSKVMEFAQADISAEPDSSGQRPSQLRQWPVQIKLVPASAPYLQNADLLIAADCVPFAYADFHRDFLKGRILLVGCPKLDNVEFYTEKITQIFRQNNIKSITCVYMEVPCCFGLVQIVKQALQASGKEIRFQQVTVGIKGEKK